MSKIIADARRDNWVDAWAPEFAKPYLKLARFDRPVGVWLLLWPCWWSIALTRPAAESATLRLFVLFGLGALLMRGAGCVLNDMADRKIDAAVERTRHRPLASGEVSLFRAALWMLLLALAGLAILLQLPMTAIWLGVGSLGLVAVYPFMKRITWWPQAWLGLTFNWGALMGWAAVNDGLGWPALWLYLGGVFWTLGYDTIYAHQDKDDDALIGVKSSARRLGRHSRAAIAVFYTLALAFWGLAAWWAGLSHWFAAPFAAVALHLFWQTARVRFDDREDCLAKFRANTGLGALMLLALVLGAFGA